jgi:hypothetical protein
MRRERGGETVASRGRHRADHVDAAILLVIERHQHRRGLAVEARDVEMPSRGVKIRNQAVDPADAPELIEAGLGEIEPRRVHLGEVSDRHRHRSGRRVVFEAPRLDLASDGRF